MPRSEQLPARTTAKLECRKTKDRVRAKLASLICGKQKQAQQVYQRRLIVCCCILAGDTDWGGLDMLIPVLGLTMGIAFRIRVAAGWCSFSVG